MAEIKGFHGVRYTDRAGRIEDLVSPPYDVVDEKTRRACIEKNEHNIIRLELPEGEDKYQNAAALYRQWLDDGILAQDPDETIYIYEQQFELRGKVHRIKGMICAVRLEEFDQKIILPHENTLSKAKTDRFDLLSAAKASFSQIYSLYTDEKKTTAARLAALSAGEPLQRFTDGDGVTHSLWPVTDPAAIAELASDFSDRQLFIADGHHRYETALRYRRECRAADPSFTKDSPANFTAMFLVDMECEGLVVFPTHRMIRNYGSFDEREVLEKMNESFSFERFTDLNRMEEILAASPYQHSFAFYTGKDYFYLLGCDSIESVRREMGAMSDAYCSLDVTVLHSLILEKAFGITATDLANQTKLAYTRDIAEAIDGVRRARYSCSFVLNPTRVEQIRDVAKAGEKMPQKSTYFYPKMITGLVFINFS